jgi:hypothetical protein
MNNNSFWYFLLLCLPLHHKHEQSEKIHAHQCRCHGIIDNALPPCFVWARALSVDEKPKSSDGKQMAKEIR